MGVLAGRYDSAEDYPADSRAACDALVPPGSVVANFHNTAYWMKTTVPDSAGAPATT